MDIRNPHEPMRMRPRMEFCRASEYARAWALDDVAAAHSFQNPISRIFAAEKKTTGNLHFKISFALRQSPSLIPAVSVARNLCGGWWESVPLAQAAIGSPPS
eukprot:scaffold7366_cov254-Pinguiococcus_pyrenoidosus.AAC.22